MPAGVGVAFVSSVSFVSWLQSLSPLTPLTPLTPRAVETVIAAKQPQNRFLLRNQRNSAEVDGTGQPARTAHSEPVADYTVFSPTRALRLRVSVHCRWARKPKSATLRAKECERNRTDCRCRLALSRNEHRLLPQAFRSYSFNRGAADLDDFAIANERQLSDHGKRVAKASSNRPHSLAGWAGRLGCSVPFLSAPFRAFRSKKQFETKTPLKAPTKKEGRLPALLSFATERSGSLSHPFPLPAYARHRSTQRPSRQQTPW